MGGVVPKEYIPAVDKGIQEQLKSGVLAGYPVLDVKVSLFDGSYHDVDSNEMAFKICGAMALRSARSRVRCALSVRVPGIEPGSFDWQPNVLPLNHTR